MPCLGDRKTFYSFTLASCSKERVLEQSYSKKERSKGGYVIPNHSISGELSQLSEVFLGNVPSWESNPIAESAAFSLLRDGAASSLAPLISAIPADPELLVDGHATNVGHYFALLFSGSHMNRSALRTNYSSSSGLLSIRFLRLSCHLIKPPSSLT